MINRGFKREDKKNIPDSHRVVKIYRISGAALTCSLITARDKLIKTWKASGAEKLG